MSNVFPHPLHTLIPANRGKIAPQLWSPVGAFRLATDPLFYADLTLRNVVAGSRYRVTRADTGAELATGLVPGSGLVDHVIADVACYANPQEVTVTVRQGTSAPKYLPYEAPTAIAKAGGLAFISQVPDSIAA